METACLEMSDGKLDEHIIVDAYQGGAGTSTNLNVCEVLANRTLVLLGYEPGAYTHCDPIAHFNMHQSTNDVYPTALRVAALKALQELEPSIVELLEACQTKEREFQNILKTGRTELMDAVPMSLGRTFGAWAEALARDRWRIYKSGERFRVINLGGTAIGTGLGAPRDYIFRVAEELKQVTGLPLARAENLVEATQNLDVFIEVMGMLKAHALTLAKMSADLRLLSMGPQAGISELTLPPLQAGSSIMPGKINPVIPEMLQQISMQVAAYDQAISWAVASGQLELNAFLPLIALDLLSTIDLLSRADRLSAERCVRGIQANAAHCRDLALRSSALATVLVPLIGYHRAQEVSDLMSREGIDVVQAAGRIAGIPPEQVEKAFSPEALNSLWYNNSLEIK